MLAMCLLYQLLFGEETHSCLESTFVLLEHCCGFPFRPRALKLCLLSFDSPRSRFQHEQATPRSSADQGLWIKLKACNLCRPGSTSLQALCPGRPLQAAPVKEAWVEFPCSCFVKEENTHI